MPVEISWCSLLRYTSCVRALCSPSPTSPFLAPLLIVFSCPRKHTINIYGYLFLFLHFSGLVLFGAHESAAGGVKTKSVSFQDSV